MCRGEETRQNLGERLKSSLSVLQRKLLPHPIRSDNGKLRCGRRSADDSCPRTTGATTRGSSFQPSIILLPSVSPKRLSSTRAQRPGTSVLRMVLEVLVPSTSLVLVHLQGRKTSQRFHPSPGGRAFRTGQRGVGGSRGLCDAKGRVLRHRKPSRGGPRPRSMFRSSERFWELQRSTGFAPPVY